LALLCFIPNGLPTQSLSLSCEINHSGACCLFCVLKRPVSSQADKETHLSLQIKADMAYGRLIRREWKR